MDVGGSADARPVSGRFEFQLRMLEKGAAEIQAQVSHLDELLFKIKASFITVWAATIGWSFTITSGRLR